MEIIKLLKVCTCPHSFHLSDPVDGTAIFSVAQAQSQVVILSISLFLVILVHAYPLN